MKLVKMFTAPIIGMLLMAGVFISFSPKVLATTAKETVCTSISGVTDSSGCNGPADSPSVYKLLAAAINLLSLVAGVIAIIMIIVGAMKYMTSGGDGNAIASAKNTILYALVGLVLAALAQVIVHYVLNKAAH